MAFTLKGKIRKIYAAEQLLQLKINSSDFKKLTPTKLDDIRNEVFNSQNMISEIFKKYTNRLGDSEKKKLHEAFNRCGAYIEIINEQEKAKKKEIEERNNQGDRLAKLKTLHLTITRQIMRVGSISIKTQKDPETKEKIMLTLDNNKKLRDELLEILKNVKVLLDVIGKNNKKFLGTEKKWAKEKYDYCSEQEGLILKRINDIDQQTTRLNNKIAEFK